jgi:hypothetical protein
MDPGVKPRGDSFCVATARELVEALKRSVDGRKSGGSARKSSSGSSRRKAG